MDNWKTTLTALLVAISSIFAHFGILVTPDIQAAIVTLGLVVIGLLAKDASNKKLTGEEK